MFTCLLFALTVWAPRSANASLIVPKKITLKALVARAQVIVIVRANTPFTRNVLLAHRRGDRNKKKCAAFKKTLSRFVLLKVLKNASGRALAKRVEVADANWRLYQGMQQAYCLGQPVPSPIIPAYDSGFAINKLPKNRGNKALLFLVADGAKGYRFAAMGAYDSPKAARRVRALINAAKAAPKPRR